MAILEIGKNDLETWCIKNAHTDILEDWDYEGNKGRKNKFGNVIDSPRCIMAFSNIKVAWVCKKGHHYEATPGNRTVNNCGCPYCSGSKLLAGYNDFETWCKENGRLDLLTEWNYEKNNGLKPRDIIQGGAGKKYWWKGTCGHEWDAVISSRTQHRRRKDGNVIKYAGCPYCSTPPKRILVGFNDFESWCNRNERKSLLDEWNYDKNDIRPSEVTFASGKKIWWKCNKNHEWITAINQRTTGSKTNCPICARTQTSFPEQALAFYLMKNYEILQRFRIKGKEADIFLPDYNIAIEYDGLMWHQGERKKQDIQKAQIFIDAGVTLIRVRENTSSNSVIIDNGESIIDYIVNNGKYITPDLEWAILELYKIVNSKTGKKELPDICLSEDEFNIRAHYMNVLKDNSVASVFPELISEWDIEKNGGVTPDSFSARNNKKVWWKCTKGHSWLASINTRGDRKLGCPYCAGQKVISGENDFATWCKKTNSCLIEEWDYKKNTVNPEEIPRTYKEKVFWKCLQGHEWQATVYNRVNGTGCPVCNNSHGKKRNKTTLEEWALSNGSNLCEEWDYSKNDGKTPKDYSYGSHEKVWWKCASGHEWQAQIKSRTYNHGCPYCSSTNKRAVKGKNDLETWCKENDREYILQEWDYENNGELRPDMVTAGSHKRVFWKCEKGHSWNAVIKERTKVNGNMCPICRIDHI